MKKTSILCFDTPSKCKLFKKSLGNVRNISITETHNPDVALRELLLKKHDVILLGGDVADESYKSAALYHMMEEWDIHKSARIYITSWNVEEARILRSMSKNSVYIPMCDTVGKMVRTTVYGKRAKQNKQSKNKRKEGK